MRASGDYLECWHLTKTYPGPDGPVAVVDELDLQVREGEFVCLIGHSGCGKSTVLSMIAGLTTPSAGGIVLAGREVTGPGPDRGVVFQAPCLLPWMTALGNVRLAVDAAFPDRSAAERTELAVDALCRVGLGSVLDKRPDELSGGMRQRVGIARAFALSPKMLLLDEPFGMLDQLTRMELQDVLIDLWQRDGRTALMVTHDVDEALFLADRIAMMTNGPAARLGGILDVPFERPRWRSEVLEHPEYDSLRAALIEFLESQETPTARHAA